MEKGKQKAGDPQLAMHNSKAAHEGTQNYETIMTCPIASEWILTY